MFAHLGPNLQLPWGGAAHGESVQRDLGHSGLELACSLGVRCDGVEGRKLGASGEISGTHLCKVFAHGLGGDAEVVAEGARIASLAGALAVELARNMRCVCERGAGPGSACSQCLGDVGGGRRRGKATGGDGDGMMRCAVVVVTVAMRAWKGVKGWDGPTRRAPRPVKSASSRHGRHDAIGVGRLLLGLGVLDVEASASRVAKLGGIVGGRHGCEGKGKRKARGREPRAGTWKQKRWTGKGLRATDGRVLLLSGAALLCCGGGGVAEGRGGPILLSAFALQRGARAWAVRRAVVRAGRKSLKGSGAPSNRQSANRRSSRGAGQQPTEAGTERGSVAAWLAWAAPTSTGSCPPIVGYLDRQLETESLSPRPRRWSDRQWTLEERSGWAKTRADVEETHGESAAARELVFIVHSIAPCLGSDLQVRIMGSALRAPISRQ